MSNSNNIAAWNQVSSAGPKTAHACGCVIGTYLYIHGGIDQNRSTHPLSSLHRFNKDASTWETLSIVNSPALSHHACIASENRYMLTIGGWNGKERTSSLFAFDTQEQLWIEVKNTGFPTGAGLSSHTASLLSSGDILVIGREGSLRTQRRSGNAFLLSGKIDKKGYKYSEHTLGVASRSGHTSDIIASTLVVLGGRDDKLLETHRISSQCSKAHTITKLRNITDTITAMTKPPVGRKYHSTMVVGNALLVFGGETFDGRSREPVADMYLLEVHGLSWKHLGKLNIGRAGQIMCSIDDSVILHGGIGEGNDVSNSTYVLSLF